MCAKKLQNQIKRVKEEELPARQENGRDEMNLAEFPIALLAKRPSSKMKTFTVSDTITGKDGKEITRKWTVTGSDAFGLPTSTDDEVIVALLYFTKEHGFESRKIHFSRYDLIRVMGWRDEGKNYTRIKDALNRLTGMMINAENAFYDPKKQTYMKSCAFHIMESYLSLGSGSGE